MDLTPRRDAAEAARLAEARARELEATHGKPAKVEAEPVRFSPDEMAEAVEAGEFGFSRLAVKALAGRVCWDNGSQRGYVFNPAGGHWREDSNSQGLVALRDALVPQLRAEGLRLLAAVPDLPDEQRPRVKRLGKRLVKAADELGQLRKLKSVWTLACTGENSLAVDPAGFDADPWLFGVANGVLDLRTGLLRPGRPGDFITRHSPVAWDSLHAPRPAWEAFLASSLEGGPEIVEYLRLSLGSCLVGRPQKRVFILYGPNDSGKTVTLETVGGSILGGLGQALPAALVMLDTKRGAGPESELLELRGRRFAYLSETQRGGKLNCERLKLLSGGDSISARPLYGRLTTFQPTHTLWLATNHRPVIGAGEGAIWSRLQLVHFPFTFCAEPRLPHERAWDPDLRQKLNSELPGILGWLVGGCLDWQAAGCQVATPDSLKASRDSYRLDEDAVALFALARCEASPGQEVAAQAVYGAFKSWHESEFGDDAHVLGPKAFWSALEQHYPSYRHPTKGTRTFKGLHVKP